MNEQEKKIEEEQKNKRQEELKNEAKDKKFKRLANKRMQNAIKRIRQIGKLSNPSVYEYDEDQVHKIVDVLIVEINNLENNLNRRFSNKEEITEIF